MSELMQSPQQKEEIAPSLDLFFETVFGFQRTSAIRAAIELDVFTPISKGIDTSEALAQRCKTSERGMRILCDYLVVIGFLIKSEKRYELTPDSKTFLDRSSPAYVGSTIKLLLSPLVVEAFSDLAASVRKGGTTTTEEGITAPEHPVWVEFARSMDTAMMFPAELLAKLVGADSGQKWKVLDIAAGHGRFGLTIAKHNPNAEVVAVDWRNVLVVAEENARSEGLANRFRTIPGSAFDVDYGSGYDLVLLTGFLHHFGPGAIEKLLSKTYAALKSDGRAVILEFIPNEDRVSPRISAEFALQMLATTPSGDAYTFAEYERMLERVGFVGSELHPLPPTFFRAVIARRKS